MADSAPAEETTQEEPTSQESENPETVSPVEPQQNEEPNTQAKDKLPPIDGSKKKTDKLDKKPGGASAVTLPSIKHQKDRRGSKNQNASGAETDRELSYSSLSPKEKNVNSTWKDNKDVKDWLQHKDSQIKERKSHKVRQAMKDANWILERRERQMKEIQKRQKAEKVGVKGGMEEVLSKDKEKRPRVSNRQALEHFQEIGNKVKFVANTVHEMGYNMPYPGTFPGGIGRHRGELTWKPCPAQKKHKLISRDKDCGVWIKPGFFTTKIVTH